MIYFGARYYDPNQPRFMSADWADKPEAVPYSDLDDPQSLNLYTYVRNNPVSRTDVDGHECPVCDEVSQELVDSVVSPLIQSAEVTGSAALNIGCRIFCGAVAVVYSMTVGAEPLGTADEAERAHKARESQQSKQDEESKDAQPEPKPSTEGASAAKGGGKNDRKINQQRKQSAQDKIASLRQQRDALESKANKTPADKEALAKINNQLKREIDRQRKSETHSRRHKGTLE